jgi:hypothetical protein
MERIGRTGIARFFEPADRLLGARLQQMDRPDQLIPVSDPGVAGATAQGLLLERDHLVYRSRVELAQAQTI